MLIILLGIALRLAGQNFFKTSGSIADVAQTLMEPRGLGFRLKDAVLMENLIDGKKYAKSLILGKANVNVRSTCACTDTYIYADRQNKCMHNTVRVYT